MTFHLTFSIWFGLFSATAINYCVTSHNQIIYIVTSPESYCPTEFMGEPCLTLTEYASLSSQSSNVTLILESGNHYLTEPITWSDSDINNIESFVMTTDQEHANIIIHMSQMLDASVSQFVQISGITFKFTGNMRNNIVVSGAQEVIVSECNFQGVSFSLEDITNAIVSRCNFSNYHQNSYYYYSRASLNVRDFDTAVAVVKCNFSNNERAIGVYRYIGSYFYRYSYYTVNSTWSLNITSCTFFNTWGSSVVYFSMTVYIRYYYYYYGYSYTMSRYYRYANLNILNSTFINNTSKYNHGNQALCFKIMLIGNRYEYDNNWLRYYYYHARPNIIDSTFINNTYKEGGAVYFGGNIDNATLFVHRSSFIGNTANQTGGTMYLQVDGRLSNVFIGESSFIRNSANSCGALNINVTEYSGNNVVQISDSIFNYNSAASEFDIGGGAACILNTSAIISNCTFTGNTAEGLGGALASHDSNM